MNRRRFLTGTAAATAAALAGCSSVLNSTPEFSGAADPWSNDADRELSNGYEYAGTVTLPENTWAQITHQLNYPANIEVFATSNSPMDVFILGENEFNRYRDEEDFQYSSAAAATNATDIQFSAGLNGGTSYTVFDNAQFTGAYPGEEISADYTVRLTA